MTSTKPTALPAALLTISGTAACSTDHPDLGLDRGVTASCPREIAAPGDLVAMEVLTLPEGRKDVPFGNVIERENMLTRGALVYRDGYRACRSVVITRRSETEDSVGSGNASGAIGCAAAFPFGRSVSPSQTVYLKRHGLHIRNAP